MKSLSLLLAAFTVAVSRPSMKVNNDHARELVFSNYETSTWHDGDTSLQEENMLGHERVVQAVDGEMAAKVFSKVSSKKMSQTSARKMSASTRRPAIEYLTCTGASHTYGSLRLPRVN